MQTTLRIDDELYREAKAEAAREGVTLTRFLEDGLRLRLQKGKRSHAPLRLPSYSKGEPFPWSPAELKEIANREQEAFDLEKLKAMDRRAS
jgi:hypothetical protein